MDEGLNLVTVCYGHKVRGEEVDALHRRALRADRLCVRLDLGLQLAALKRAGEDHGVRRRQSKEACGEPQAAREVGMEGLEVATLITANCHRPGRRKEVAGESCPGQFST
jgi:hypothetical protein